MSKIQVILDTDIGGDIDDTWALGMLLNTEELDLKMVSVVSHDVEYKAKIVCRFLEKAGREDIPVALGISTSDEIGCQSDWVKDYSLSQYPGTVFDNAVDQIAEIVRNSDRITTVICIGTFTNMAAFAEKYPDLIRKIKIVTMAGSVYKDIEGKNNPIPECNVYYDIPAAKKVFSLGWDILMAPVDVCATARLFDDHYAAVLSSGKIIPTMIIEQYKNWTRVHPELGGNPEKFSSILWDTVAVYLVNKRGYLDLKNIPIVVDDKGYTRVDQKKGKNVFAAIAWKDLPGFQNYLTKVLTS